MKNKSQVLTPTYMRNFSCIGSECEDSCCTGWKIFIDRFTYKKYKNFKDTKIKQKVKDNIKRNRLNPVDQAYANIKLSTNRDCPFLDNRKLCEIQLRYGESYLSNVCAKYPRIFNNVDSITEKSAVVSCPEIARLVLTNPDGIEFDEIEEFLETRDLITKHICTEDSGNNKAENYFWNLRIFTIQLLQNRKYSLPDRLIILGMFYLDIQDVISKGNLSVIPEIIQSFNTAIDNGELREPLSEVPVLFEIQMKFLNLLTEAIVKKDNKRYIECYNEFISGLEYTENANIEDVLKNYNEAYNEFYLPFISKQEYLLENYLVNYVFTNVFPFSIYTSVYDEYNMLIIHYALIKFHLIGMSRHHKGLNEKLVVKLVQSFAKNFEHNRPILKTLLNLLKKVQFTKMSDMMILIKN